MTLSNRLRRVAEQVPPGSVVADIGTDHGYLPVDLVSSGRCPRAIATDIAAGPLAAARALVEREGLSDRIQLRRGEGLAVLAPGEADTLVLAGMGGVLMARLLGQRPEVAHSLYRLVLQPMTAAASLRRWLAANGFRFVHEELVEDGDRIYEIIVTEPGEEPGRQDMPDIMYEVGPILAERRDPLLDQLLAERIRRLEKALADLAGADSAGARRAEAVIRKRLEELREVRSWLFPCSE